MARLVSLSTYATVGSRTLHAVTDEVGRVIARAEVIVRVELREPNGVPHLENDQFRHSQ